MSLGDRINARHAVELRSWPFHGRLEVPQTPAEAHSIALAFPRLDYHRIPDHVKDGAEHEFLERRDWQEPYEETEGRERVKTFGVELEKPKIECNRFTKIVTYSFCMVSKIGKHNERKKNIQIFYLLVWNLRPGKSKTFYTRPFPTVLVHFCHAMETHSELDQTFSVD